MTIDALPRRAWERGDTIDRNSESPKVRFTKFSEESGYSRYHFDDIFTFSSGKNIKQNEASPEYETPCVRYGELYHLYGEVITKVINKTNIDHSELRFSCGNEILLPSAGEDPLDIGSASALTVQGVAIGRTINVLSPKGSVDYSHTYVSFYINGKLRRKISTLARGATISNVYNSDLKGLKINLPQLEEQQKIADFLSSVDQKVALLKEKHALLAQYKKGVMQKLFSQAIRFKGEKGNDFPDWKEERFSNVLLLQLNALKMNDESEYELITVRRRNGGVDSRGIYKGKEVLVKNQFELKTNQFVISKRQIVHGACGLVPEKLAGAIVSNEYNVFEAVAGKLDINYFNLIAVTLPMKRAFFINSNGVHIEKLLFKTESWLKTKLNFPSVDEQKKIVTFIESLDKKITLVSEQITHTQTFKKGLLQQMFV